MSYAFDRSDHDGIELGKALMKKALTLARQKLKGGSFAANWGRVELEHPELAEVHASREPIYRYLERPALVQCQASFDLDAPTPEEIVYLPAGSHSIRPKVNGQPKNIRLTVDALAAERLQRDLLDRLSRNVRPHGGFNHQAGPAAFVPKEFRWDPERGVVLKVDWTLSGRKAVLGRDYAHFSPTFLLDGDRVAGLPPNGEIGSLVNSPAFPDIPRIAASDESDSMPVYSASGEFLGEVVFDT